MKYDFIEKTINIKEIPKEIPVDLCLIENNENQIEKICNFLLDDSKLLLVNGFRGSGKSTVVNFTINYGINLNTVVLNYTCLETTILDDMLLNFFETFRNYVMTGLITPPKIKVDNFTQKINSYFKTIDKPILIILDSFDSIIKENKQEIINFIKHLITFPNIKVIIISKKTVTTDFADVTFEQAAILPLSQKLFEKFLKANGIKQIGVLSNELYKQSKGYYSQVVLSVNIMNLRQLSLVNFLELFSKSCLPFNEFVIREAAALIDPVSAHLFRLLTVMRIPLHINLIKSLHLFDENRIMFFLNNSILSVYQECLYIKEDLRYVLENQIPDNVMIKLHKACIDLYNTQLPLKPLERDLKLSRQTMRNEIEYHSMFIPKKPVITLKSPLQIQPSAIQELPQEHSTPQIPEPEETREEKLNKISFIIEDEAVLDNIADTIKDFVVTTAKKNEFEHSITSMTLSQIINAAKQEEAKYNYKEAVTLYQNALTKTSDDNFYTFLPTIYIKLAKAYQNLSDLYNALEYYTQAQDFYINASNTVKACEVKLETANIYYMMYKHENAKFILSELEKISDLPNELVIKINLACAKLNENLNIEYEYYKKSLPLVDIDTDKSVITELYYKYAAACHEKDELKSAAIYYKKCIETDQNPKNNTYLSLALSNLAELYDQAGQTKFALKYYGESVKIDTENKNYNGLYNSAVHLAEIFVSSDDSKAIKYMNKALEYAEILKEPFYIAGACLDLGDFYYLRRNNEKAFEYFIKAYNTAKNTFSKDNLDKITSRIDDIKKHIPEEIFNEYREKYEK